MTVIFYASFGLPTPDEPGLIEAITGAGLILSLGISANALRLFQTPMHEPAFITSARLLLLYGLSVPLLMGLFLGNHIGDILRDIFPFLFLLLPFFAYQLFQTLSKTQINYFIYVLIACGVILSLRGLIAYGSGAQINIADLDILYVLNSPLVLFAALYLISQATTGFRINRAVFALVCAALAIIPVFGMAAVLQRASFGALFITACVAWLWVMQKSLLRALILLCAGMSTLYIMHDFFIPLSQSLFEKNAAVGSNMRLYELQAVWERVCNDSLTALFGQGWGGPLKSPAVGGLSVNYTHSLMSAALLKTGLVGCLLTACFLGTLFLRFPPLFKTAPLMALCLFWPFVIDIFLYASYKSLDFGLILLLIAYYGLRSQEHTTTQKPDCHTQYFDDKPHCPAHARSNRASVI